MDLSSLMGGGTPEQERKPTMEYTAQSSGAINGEVKLTIDENTLNVTALFDAIQIPFARIQALIFADYVVKIKTDEGDYTFSGMGSWAERFYDALYDAYNKAVLRALFVTGEPILKVNGEYHYTEDGKSASGKAPIELYENCVVILPPDLNARRVPLCFVNGMGEGDYECTLRLSTGESYTFKKLGYDTAIFADTIKKQIRKLYEKALEVVSEFDPALSATQASQIVKLVPEGVAAPIGKLTGIAPSFVTALEEKLANTRANDSYKAFRELCDPSKIYIGFKKNEAAEGGMGEGMIAGLGGLLGGKNPLSVLGGIIGGATPNDGEEIEAPPPDPYLFWLIAPSPDGRYATVEFSEADTATFVYDAAGDFDGFLQRLNRALEAIDFKREIIRLSDDELIKKDNADYYMASKRTTALQFVRANFSGRVIHSSPQAWRNKLTAMWGDAGDAEQREGVVHSGEKFCGQCGAKLTNGIKFCGECGQKV